MCMLLIAVLAIIRNLLGALKLKRSPTEAALTLLRVKRGLYDFHLLH
jgi:hypothetical protein